MKKNIGLSLFVLSVVMSLILALPSIQLEELAISALYPLRIGAYLVFFMSVHKRINDKKFQVEPYIITSIILTLIFSFSQYFLFPALEPLFAAGWDRHLYRLAGTWLDTGFTGIILILQFLYVLPKAIAKYKLNKQKAAWMFLLLGCIFVALLLTYSRSSYIAFCTGLGVYLVYLKRLRILLFIIAILLLGTILIPRTFGEGTKLLRTSTIFSRYRSWEQGVQLWLQKPVFGHGFNTLRYVKRDEGLEGYKWNVSHSAAGLENSLLFLLATTGLVGTGSFLYWLFTMLKENMKDLLLVSSIASVFVHGMFANTWFYPWVILWIGILSVSLLFVKKF